MNTQTNTSDTLESILALGSEYLRMPMSLGTDDDAAFNAMEFAQALYWHCVQNYDGMGSIEYWIQCNLGYKPSIMENGVSADNSIVDIYGDSTISYFIHEYFHRLNNIKFGSVA